VRLADLKHGWKRRREQLRQRPRLEFGYRILIAVVGLAVLAVGIIAIPYPGPGWAIVFLGLGILATEFNWARRLLAFARQRYDWFMERFHEQPAWVQVLAGLFTALIVALTLWLLGALDWMAELVNLELEWLNSPIGIGD
jgi:uncharacterized protein (TIGR02611 family)